VAAYLFCIGELFKEYESSLRDGVRRCEIREYDPQAFPKYVRRQMDKISYERCDVYLLDCNAQIMGYKSFSTAQKKEVRLKLDEISQLLVNEKPSGIVVVHNHPTASAKPSLSDLKTTEALQNLCDMNKVLLCEHMICGSDGVYGCCKGLMAKGEQ
jgi:DNA repair protein RadC